MEPQLPNPNFGNVLPPSESKKPEAAPSSNSSGSEIQPTQPIEGLKSVESYERTQSVVNSASSLAATLPVTVPQPVGTDDTTVLSLGQAATLASNDDVMEKEWVNRSKKIVRETRGDPYRKEHEISKLQADYVKKRYGKEVKVPDDV
jgi:hypothetical protein